MGPCDSYAIGDESRGPCSAISSLFITDCSKVPAPGYWIPLLPYWLLATGYLILPTGYFPHHIFNIFISCDIKPLP